MDECKLSNLLSVDAIKCIFTSLKNINWSGALQLKIPALTKKHLKARLSWSKRYELHKADALNRIIFCDETRIALHSNKQEFVRGHPGKWYSPCYTVKTEKFWEYIKTDGSIRLVKIDGNLNSTKYI